MSTETVGPPFDFGSLGGLQDQTLRVDYRAPGDNTIIVWKTPKRSTGSVRFSDNGDGVFVIPSELCNQAQEVLGRLAADGCFDSVGLIGLGDGSHPHNLGKYVLKKPSPVDGTLYLIRSSGPELKSAPLPIVPIKVPEVLPLTCIGRGDECAKSWLLCISSARQSLDLLLYTFSDPRVFNAILDAQLRGVRVRCVVDAEGARMSNGFALACEINANATRGSKAVVVSPDKGGSMHCKCVISDSTTAVLGSYNPTITSAEKNLECVAYIEDAGASRSLSRSFQAIWERIHKSDDH